MIINLSSLIEVTGLNDLTILAYVTVIAYSGGHLLLLAAFGVGLPEVDEFDDEDAPEPDDEEGAFDDFEDGRRGGNRGPGRLVPPAGNAAARLRTKLSPSSTCSIGAYGPGIRKHGRPARATPASWPHGSGSARPAQMVAARL